MKKKFGAVVAAGVMSCAMVASIAATGCGGGFAEIHDFVMPEGGYDGSKVTITFANTMGQNLAEVTQDAIKRFNDIYPNITVKIDKHSNYDTLESTISTRLTTGRQPHVSYCYSDHVALYNQSKAVIALDEFFLPGSGYEDKTATTGNGSTVPLGLTQDEVDNYVKEFYAEGSVFGDEHTYTLPFAKSTEVLYYNKDKFDEYDLEVPETWEDMGKLCADILKIDEVKNNQEAYPLSYDSEANWFITMCEQYGQPYTTADGDNHFLFNTEANKNFVTMLKGWKDNGYFITKGTNNNTYTSNKFTNEQCFMSIGSTGGSSYQKPDSTDGVMKFNVGVATIPQVNKETPKSILQGPSVCIFKKENPQEVLASWLLVKFLTTDFAFQARFSELSGYMPVTYSTIEDETYQEFLGESSLTAIVAKASTALVDKDNEQDVFFTSDAFHGSSKAREQVELLMLSVLKNRSSVDQAFTDAINACNKFVGKK